MILAGLDTILRIYLQGNGIAHLEHALRHPAYMTDLSSLEMDDILYGKFTMRSDDRAGISLLAAHGCIERRHIRNDGALQAIGQRFHNLVGSGKGCCPSAVLQTVIAGKLCGQGCIQRLINVVAAHVIALLSGAACLFTLNIHGLFKTIRVNGKALLLQDLLRQIQRESVGII